MNTEDRSRVHQALLSRRHAIADDWHKAIARTSFVSLKAAEVRQHLVELTEEAIALLFTEPFEHGRAEAIGASLAGFHYVEPEALGRTQEVLARQLVEGLPADQVIALQPRLAALLGGLATGFFQQARETTLTAQEQIRGSMIAELRRTQEALQKAYCEVEQQVQERSAELRATNESLQREITERKQTEEALRESEERFQQVTENAHEWIWEVDAHGLYAYASPMVEKILGYKPEEVVGEKRFYDLFHPEDREEMKKAAFEVFARRQSFRGFINRNVCKDGETVWLSTSGVPMLDAEGNLLGYRGTDTDITERKLAEAALEKSREQIKRAKQEWESTADSLPQFVCLLDHGGHIIRANRTVERWNLGRVGDVKGREVHELFHPGCTDPACYLETFCLRAWEELSRGQSTECEAEDRVLNRHLHVQVQPILSQTDGEEVEERASFAVLSVHDITERKRAEERIEHLNLVLHAIRSVNQLIAKESDRGRLLQGTCDSLVETRGYHNAWVALVDESGRPALSGAEGPVAIAEAGLGEAFLPMVERLKRGKLTDCGQRALRQSGVLVITDPLSACTDCPLSANYGGRGAMIVRLEYSGKVYGLLFVSIPRDIAADKEERVLFEEVAGDIAFALHSIELEEERKRAEEALRKAHDELEMRVRERTAELAQANQALRRERDLAEALEEAAAVVSSTLDHNQVLDRILEQVNRVIPNDAANVMLIEDGQVRMARWRGYQRFGVEEFVSTLVFHAPGMPALQQMMETGEPIVIPDTATYPGWVHVPEMEWLRSYAAAPVVVRGQVIGFLNVDSATPGFFTPAHVEALHAFADHAAAAIENAHLFEQAQQEIAERKRAEEALQASEKRYHSLFEGVPVGLYRTTPTGQILDSNLALVQMLGYPDRESLQAVNVADLYVDLEERTRWQTLIERGRIVRDFEAQFCRRDGTVLWVRDSARAVCDADGGVRYYEGSLEDITERKRAEEALRRAHKELEIRVEERTAELTEANQALQAEIIERKRAEEALQRSRGQIERAKQEWESTADSLPQFVCLLDHQGRIIRANRTVERWNLGRVRDVKGREVHELFHPGCADPACYLETFWLRAWEELAQGRPAECEAKDRVLKRHLHVQVRPILAQTDGEVEEGVSFAAVSVHDITERKRAEEEIEQRNRELSALNVIAATVNRSLDLEEMLSEALDKVLGTMELEVGAIRLLDEQDGTLDLKVRRGVDLSPQMVERISWAKLAEGSLAEVIATGEPLIIEDISDSPMVELIGRRDLKSLAVIPLESKGRVLGTMEIVSLDPRQFTSEEIRLLISIGHQIGVAIENAVLYEEVQNSAAQSASLLEIGQSLTSSLDLDRTLRLIVAQAAKLLKTDICTLFLYDRDTDELIGQTSYGANGEELRGTRVPLSQSQIAAKAKTTLKPVVVEDASQDHRVPAKIVETLGTKSSLTIPLVAEGRFLGVIFLYETKAPRRFTASEIELAQSFVSQAAIALENAQLYAHSEELAISKERNRIAREIHDDLIQRLASLLMRVDLCLELMDEEPEEAKREIDKIGVTLQDSIQEARRLIFALRPLALEQLGFHRALCTYIDNFAHQNKISTHLSLPEDEFRLPARVEYTLFRIVQEALNNVRWHAQADTVWIDLVLRQPDAIWLEIQDNGRGFDLAEESSNIPGDDRRGMGLLHMRERVEAMKGSFRIEELPTAGTKIMVILPLES